MLFVKQPLDWHSFRHYSKTFAMFPPEIHRLADDLAVQARSEKLGVLLLQDIDGRFAVMVFGDESETVGFGRKIVKEGRSPCFLRYKEGQLLRELPDRSREPATFTESGFRVGEMEFRFTTSYCPAQNNTALGHSQGFDVGEHLCTDDPCPITAKQS